MFQILLFTILAVLISQTTADHFTSFFTKGFKKAVREVEKFGKEFDKGASVAAREMKKVGRVAIKHIVKKPKMEIFVKEDVFEEESSETEDPTEL